MQYVKGRGERVFGFVTNAHGASESCLESCNPTPNDADAVDADALDLHPSVFAHRTYDERSCKPRSESKVSSSTPAEMKAYEAGERVSEPTLTSADATGTAKPARAEQGRRINVRLAVAPRVLLSAAATYLVTSLTHTVHVSRPRSVQAVA